MRKALGQRQKLSKNVGSGPRVSSWRELWSINCTLCCIEVLYQINDFHYVLQLCGFSFHSLNIVFHIAKLFNFN